MKTLLKSILLTLFAIITSTFYGQGMYFQDYETMYYANGETLISTSCVSY